ncbi:MAG: hypothetical protein V9G98_00005 [Candidatus Competibacter sp.]
MSQKSVIRLFAVCILATLAGTAWGWDKDYALDDIVVTAPRPAGQPLNTTTLSTGDLTARRYATSDTASLLSDVPGVGLQGAGGVSSLPIIHGLADDRVRIQSGRHGLDDSVSESHESGAFLYRSDPGGEHQGLCRHYPR